MGMTGLETEVVEEVTRILFERVKIYPFDYNYISWFWDLLLASVLPSCDGFLSVCGILPIHSGKEIQCCSSRP